MTGTLFTGPLITVGNAMDTSYGSSGVAFQKTASDAGPNISYRGNGFIDVRYAPVNKEQLGSLGVINAFFNSGQSLVVNAVPSAIGATGNISAAANASSGTASTLAAASAGIATGIPFLPFGSSTVVTANMAIDMGFDSANCTSGSATITVADSSIYKAGQPICIANVGNSGGTTSLLTFVTSIASATTIVVNDKPQATNSATPIDTALPGWGNLQGLGPIEPTYCAPFIEGGVGLYYDCRRIFSRGISVTGVSGGAGGAFLVVGYDGWGFPQSETVTATSGATTVNSLKTYKYITSITPQFSDAHNYSWNTSDIYGFPLFSKYFHEVDIAWNSTGITSSTGYTAGVATSPATKTTGDSRGKYAVQSSSDGTKRLAVYQVPSFQEMSATPDNQVPLFGVTPNAT